MPRRNPARNARPLLEAPVRLRTLWCMHCLRTAIGEWQKNQLRPFVINCVMDAKASVACKQCSGRASTCIPAATAMLGDCQDLSDLLAWAHKTFWLDWVDDVDSGIGWHDWPYSDETRRVVAEKMMELCKSFDTSEQAHRKEHELTGNKAQVKQTRADYNAFLVPPPLLQASPVTPTPLGLDEPLSGLSNLPTFAEGLLLVGRCVETLKDDSVKAEVEAIASLMRPPPQTPLHAQDPLARNTIILILPTRFHNMGRRAALPPVAAPNFFHTREERAARFLRGLVRLLPGDEGYVPWTLAKRVFYDGVSAEVRDGLDT
ncbi:hypothetical protein N7501_000634 [Penicillium viridicatum]|nr:hypothetical protein N7501_000634 [Penicillium viridicatum]